MDAYSFYGIASRNDKLYVDYWGCANFIKYIAPILLFILLLGSLGIIK